MSKIGKVPLSSAKLDSNSYQVNAKSKEELSQSQHLSLPSLPHEQSHFPPTISLQENIVNPTLPLFAPPSQINVLPINQTQQQTLPNTHLVNSNNMSNLHLQGNNLMNRTHLEPYLPIRHQTPPTRGTYGLLSNHHLRSCPLHKFFFHKDV